MNLNNELKNGIVVIAIGKYSNLIIQFIILAILSRQLTPSEFGIVSIVNVFLVFFSMFVDFGTGPAIIQNKTLTTQQVNRIFSFTILLSIVLSVFFAFMSKPISIFYEEGKLTSACIGMSFALLTSGISMVPQAILLKEKRFIDVNIALVLSNIVYGISATVLAMSNFSYQSIIIATIIKNLSFFLFIYRKTELKISYSMRIRDLKVIYNFSRNQFLFNIINYFSRNLDKVLIGKFMSSNALAYYDKAYVLSLYPNQILTNVITPAIQPIMSDYESQKSVVKKTYLLIAKVLAFVGIPLSFFLYMSAEEVIYILSGSQWTNSITTFKILSISIWIQMILSSTGSIFQSVSRTDLLLLSGVLSSILNIMSIIIGIIMGKIEYVALLLVISFSINFVQANYLLMKKVFHSKQTEFYKLLIHPILITLLITIVLFIINMYLDGLPLILSLFIKIMVSLVIFIIGIKVTGNLMFFMKILKINTKR